MQRAPSRFSCRPRGTIQGCPPTPPPPVDGCGVDFKDGMLLLLDLRFADDILPFAKFRRETIRLLDGVVRCCASVGLVPHPSRTEILTKEAQAPNNYFASAGLQVAALLRADSRNFCTWASECYCRRGLSLKRARKAS